jgi:hypothetical protein
VVEWEGSLVKGEPRGKSMSCAICEGGLNTIVPLPVPGVDKSEGPAVDVSTLVAEKSVEISGIYVGLYVVLGSHDGINYVPVLSFGSGIGVQSFKQSMSFVLRFMKVRRRARNESTVVMNIGSKLTCPC